MTSTDHPASGVSPLLSALRVTAALAVLTVAFQFVTAGRLFPTPGPIEAHQAGAIVLHVTSGLAAICAALLWRRGTLGLGLTAVAVLTFALGFVQAAVGGYQTLYLHVPGAMLLTVGSVWLLVAGFSPRRSVRQAA